MFTFKGTSSRNMGLVTVTLPPISSNDERVETIDIPGRDGSVTISKGYAGVTKEVVVIYKGENFDELMRWLRGTGEVIFDNQPDRFYKARIVNKISFEELKINKIYKFPILFECQPYGYLNSGKQITTLTSNGTMTNPGVESEPIITVTGSGNLDLVVAQQVIKLKNVEGSITLNTQILEAYNGAELANSKVNGEFPLLPPGSFSITWTGNITRLEVVPNWRCY